MVKRIYAGGDCRVDLSQYKSLIDEYEVIKVKLFTTAINVNCIKTKDEIDEYEVRLVWDELRQLGKGVLQFILYYANDDSAFDDETYDQTDIKTTDFYIVSDITIEDNTATDVDVILAQEIQEKLNDVYTKEEVDDLIEESGGFIPDRYYNKEDIDEIVSGITDDLDTSIEELRDEIPNTDDFAEIDTAKLANADLAITDEYDNAIVIFQNGHIKTKNFDSENIDVDVDGDVDVEDDTDADFSVKDQSGNTILACADGHFKTKNFDSRNITKPTPYIYCLGSSMTQGQSGIDNPIDDNTSSASQNCYPNRLQDLVGANYHVVNLGVGGQKAGEILARNGLLDGIVKTQFTLKGNGTTSILCSGSLTATVADGVIVDSCAGEPINYQMQQGTEEAVAQMAKCYINGIQCTLSYNSSDGNLYIKRNDVVSYDLTIPVGAHITFGGNKTGDDAIYVVQVGANDLAKANMNIDSYIAKVKQGISRLDTNRWISVGVYRGDTTYQSNVNAINAKLSEEFGSRFVNILDYISSPQPFYELGITPTTDNDISAERAEHGIVSDTYCIANHITPSSFWRYSWTPNNQNVDKVHLNYNGYSLVAKLIYDKIKELNWI